MTDKKRCVEIFIGPIACSCAGGPSPAKQEKLTRAFTLKNALEKDGRFDVRIWRLGEDKEYEKGLLTLMSYLKEAGEDELATNLAFSVNSATPSVVVDGKLKYLGEAPPAERFLAEFQEAPGEVTECINQKNTERAQVAQIENKEMREMSERNPMRDEEVKRIVREGYAKVAQQGSSCCEPVSSCCGIPTLAEDVSKKIGYSNEDMEAVPEGSNLGLGCGNPVALATIKEGETVVDLGSGAGFDAFLAAQRVGESGKVIGVDMTPEMLSRARANASKAGYTNVEFRLGEIEHLPVADCYVDAIISNCVINLAPDKHAVFSEAFRILKPGGRLMVSDIVLKRELPDSVRQSPGALVGCVAGAVLKDNYLKAIQDAGFENVKVMEEKGFPIKTASCDTNGRSIADSIELSPEEIKEAADSVASISVRAYKPKAS